MKTSVARIPVQKSFCNKCAHKIKTKLLEIKNVSNVFTYEEEALIVFNFMRANQLSDVLNVLTDLGLQEKGEKQNQLQLPSFICECLFSHGHPKLIPVL